MLSLYILYYIAFLLLSIVILRINKFKLKLIQPTYTAYKVFDLNNNHLLFLVLILFFYGWRNIYFGSDFEGYVVSYKEIMNNNDLLDFYFKFYEPLSYYSVDLFTKLHIPYNWYYGVLALISYYFILKSSNNFAYLLPLIIYFTFTGSYFFFSHSAVRQSISIAIFLYSIQFIYMHNFKKYFFWILIATGFHFSAIVLLPIYFFEKIKYNRTIAFIVFIIVSIPFIEYLLYDVVFKFINFITNNLLSIYEHYINTHRIDISDAHYGIGMFIYDISRLWLIFMSKKVIKLQPQLKIYFILAILDIILIKLFWNIELIARISQYFQVCFYFALASVIYYSTSKYEKLISYGIVLLYFIVYIAGIAGLYNYLERDL